MRTSLTFENEQVIHTNNRKGISSRIDSHNNSNIYSSIRYCNLGKRNNQLMEGIVLVFTTCITAGKKEQSADGWDSSMILLFVQLRISDVHDVKDY